MNNKLFIEIDPFKCIIQSAPIMKTCQEIYDSCKNE